MNSLDFSVILILFLGAGDEIRTHDPNLGKVMLYPWATPATVSGSEIAGEGFACKRKNDLDRS